VENHRNNVGAVVGAADLEVVGETEAVVGAADSEATVAEAAQPELSKLGSLEIQGDMERQEGFAAYGQGLVLRITSAALKAGETCNDVNGLR